MPILPSFSFHSLKKCQFCGFLKPMFSLIRKASLLYKTSQIVASPFIFTIYDMGIQGVTRGYRGLQGVPRSDRGLQGVTGDYKGLQGVTGGYKGLQGVTRGYRGLQRIIETFFLTRTFTDTFSWSILHKKLTLKKSQIYDQNDGLTPLEKF